MLGLLEILQDLVILKSFKLLFHKEILEEFLTPIYQFRSTVSLSIDTNNIISKAPSPNLRTPHPQIDTDAFAGTFVYVALFSSNAPNIIILRFKTTIVFTIIETMPIYSRV